LIGIPLGAFLAKKYTNRTPLQVSGMIGLFNAVLIGVLLPNLQSFLPHNSNSEKIVEGKDESNTTKKRSGVNWPLANPFGAIYLFTRSHALFYGGLVYFLINFAHSSLQVNWINYLQYRYGWSATLAGSTLMIVGLAVAILPSVFV
jgi:hypothetical protein